MNTTPQYEFRRAQSGDLARVVEIIRSAQRRLACAGIDQWQNGYPNRERVEEDVAREYGRVLCLNGEVVAYGALVYGGESAYDALRGGEWLTSGSDYLTIHRLSVAEEVVGTGCGREFMRRAEAEGATKVPSVRVDTHPDNRTMQSLLSSLGYRYCGVVEYESPRWAYEKIVVG